MEIPDSLAEKIELWTGKARIFRAQYDLFTEDSWIAVLLGQRKFPLSHDPLASLLEAEESARFIASIRDVIQKTALAMPTHQQFIDRHCRADPLELRPQGGAGTRCGTANRNMLRGLGRASPETGRDSCDSSRRGLRR
jgi:hypothetical protein